jgi:hypothetical protein
MGKGQQRGDGLNVRARDHHTDRWRPAQAPGFFRLLEPGVQRRQRISAQVACEGPQRWAPWQRRTGSEMPLSGAK